MSDQTSNRSGLDERRALASEARTTSRARAYPEILSLLRGLLASTNGSESPAALAARKWLRAHCPGCAVPIEERQDACPDCRRTWRETTAASRPAA